MNIYRYVGNGCATYIDPDGRIVVLLAAVPIAVFVASAAATYVLLDSVSSLWESLIHKKGADTGDDEKDAYPPEKYPLKNREKRNAERRDRPKDPEEKEKRQRENEGKKKSCGTGGSVGVGSVDF